MNSFEVLGRKIGEGAPCYIIAEVSCNHEGDINEAKSIIRAAAAAGCDAVKIQTYTAETMTRNFKNVASGTIWNDVDLFDLYKKASTPWDWHSELNKEAEKNNLHFFSSPFDETAVDFLESMNVPLYKVASFEIVDVKLLQKIAKTGKPIILSTGMSNYHEILAAVTVLKNSGVKDYAILQCNSGYPGDFSDANLATIPAIKALFNCVVGLSDHIIFEDADIELCNKAFPCVTPIEAVKLGAKIIEVHLTLDRDKGRKLMQKNIGGFDWPFSRTPDELTEMVTNIRKIEQGNVHNYSSEEESVLAKKAIGQVSFEPTEKELASRNLRPTLWVVDDIKQGECFKFCGGKPGNIDSIRPGGGLAIHYADYIEGKKSKYDLKSGQPLSWDMVSL